MSEKRCDQCKYWDHTERRSASSLKVHVCTKAVQWWDATEWDDTVDDANWPNRRVIEKFAANKMFVQDGSDYRATLYTTPDFYCAHFEPAKP